MWHTDSARSSCELALAGMATLLLLSQHCSCRAADTAEKKNRRREIPARPLSLVPRLGNSPFFDYFDTTTSRLRAKNSARQHPVGDPEFAKRLYPAATIPAYKNSH